MLDILFMSKIKRVIAREILDSRGFPTVEADVELENGFVGRAAAPSGASTGIHEALELRDGDASRYLGKGVTKSVQNIVEFLGPAIIGKDSMDFLAVEGAIIDVDGNMNKSKLGANSTLAVSLAWSKAAALSESLSYAEWIHDQTKLLGYKCEMKLPVPLMNVINGGAHADNGLDIQEFMIVPHGFSSFRETLRAGVETFHHLKKILTSRKMITAVGDEGGFAPQLESNEAALAVLLEAIDAAGYKAKEQISLALDVASSEFYKDGNYCFRDPSLGRLSAEGLVDFYTQLLGKYPIVSIEDPMSEDDWAGWELLTKRLGDAVQIVGDDLFVTQCKRLQIGVDKKAANAILIKLNQVGTLKETLDTMKLAKDSSFKSIVSHRSGETEDVSLAHLAVATGCGQVKTGSASRSDRLAKYNELLRLEELLGCGLARW